MAITGDALERKILCARLRAMGLSAPYAWQVAQEKRPPSLPLAIEIWDELDVKLGPLKGRTAVQIGTLKKAARLLYETK
jgi:hypothetical protein